MKDRHPRNSGRDAHAKMANETSRPGPTALSVLKTRLVGLKDEVPIANLPNHGNTLGALVLRELQEQYPNDYLLTTDFNLFKIGTQPTTLPAEDVAHSEPSGSTYRRLQVLMTVGAAGEPVGVANIPVSPSGIALLQNLIRTEPDKIFFTTDFGQMRFGDIDPKSIETLNQQ